MSSAIAYRARWVFPVAVAPIEHGTVEIEGGRITAVHDRHDPRAHDLRDVALIPGLVNAHTHLEFSDLPQPLGPADSFAGWVGRVVAHRRQRTASPLAAVRQGWQASAAAGTTLLGEITTADETLTAFDGTGPAVCAFRELIGLLPERMDEQLALARRHLEASCGPLAPRVDCSTRGASRRQRPSAHRGLSPHAPYSVHPELFDRLVALAADHRAPVAMHLAETRAELELLRHGTGELRAMLQEFGVWRDGLLPRGARPMDYLWRLADLDRALVVHGNYLSEDETALIADRPPLTVVYCPRTHAYFGHAPHPWLSLLQRRETSVALGTDSRASNPDLSLWREMVFLRERFPAVDPALLLRIGTINGAHALGLAPETGTLEPGQSADLAVIALHERAAGGAYAQLFDARNHVAATMRSGRWIAGAERRSGFPA